MIRRKTHSLLCLLLPLGIHAQSSFSMRAALDPVPAAGFYAINVSPELSGYVQVDFRDIRVLDGAGAQVPFIIDTVDSAVENPAPRFYQKDSTDGYSYIFVLDGPYHKTMFGLGLKGPVFFQREMESGGEAYTLSSDRKDSLWRVATFKGTSWFIKIRNGDNPPLTATGVRTFQDRKRLVCYLEAGKAYHLVMDAPGVQAPVYDLEAFRSRIPRIIPTVKVGTFEPLRTNVRFFSERWIWITIILVSVILFYFSWRLTREVGRRK